MIQLYICRHGETTENKAGILQGHLPGHLNENGRLQAIRLGETLRTISADVVCCSDLQRCIDTAQLALGEKVELVLEPLLRERDWGDLTGKSIQTAQQFGLGNAESIESVMNRAEQLLMKWQQLYDGKTIVAISHGLFSRALLGVCLGISIQAIERLDNAEVRHVTLITPIQSCRIVAETGITDK